MTRTAPKHGECERHGCGNVGPLVDCGIVFLCRSCAAPKTPRGMSRRQLTESVMESVGNTNPPDSIDGQIVAEVRALYAVQDAARKVETSGVLCDPGCCGDSCGCEDLRRALGRTR
jgi:hypothetical protein